MGSGLAGGALQDAVWTRAAIPLPTATPAPSRATSRPTRADPLYIDADRLIAEHGAEYWIVGSTVTTIFETAWALRGLE